MGKSQLIMHMQFWIQETLSIPTLEYMSYTFWELENLHGKRERRLAFGCVILHTVYTML